MEKTLLWNKCPSLGESLFAVAMAIALAFLMPVAARAEIKATDGWPEAWVIDMHTHVFNARDLPLVGILNALGAPRPVAVVVAEAILGSMPEEDDGPKREFSLAQVERPAIQPLSEPQRNVLLDYVGKERREPLTAAAALQEVPPDVTLLAETLAKIGFPPEDHPKEAFAPQAMVSAADLGPALKGYIRFLGIMTKGHGEIVAALGKSYPEVDLSVHHMMDMAATYDDTPGVSFPEQIVAMQKLDAAYPGKLLHFSAFDPFRRTTALELAKRAKEKHSAVGMKIYPPSGYRAADNAIHKFPPRPGWIPDFFGRKRWNSRYAGWTEAELDKTLQEAFAWAARDKVPLFTHCTPWGFQSVPGYGMMADPLFWSSALAKKENQSLRLSFGHAGGDTYWLSNPANDEVNKKKKPPGDEWQFGNQVVELCLTYPDVYCEFGFLSGILDSTKTKDLKRRLQSVVNLRSKDGKWRFGDKIMYGTDWHMIYTAPNYDNYLKGWDEVMKQVEDEGKIKGAWRQAFFARNAKNFLRLDALSKDSRFTPDQRKQLAALSTAIK